MQKHNSTIPLEYFIDQLAAYLIDESDAGKCSLCIHRACIAHRTDAFCRYGVKAFLQGKSGEFADVLQMDLQHNRTYYDYLKGFSGEPIDVVRDALLSGFDELTDFRASAIVLNWHFLKEAA